MASTKELVKHRACDECRTRKLACTKEPDGCVRCKREGIDCHYSPQKTMGRPRKRQQQADNAVQTSLTPSIQNNGNYFQEPEPMWQQDPAIVTSSTAMDLDTAAALPMNPDLNNMSFLDFLGPNFVSEQPLGTSLLSRKIPMERGLLNININFDPHVYSQPANSTVPETTPPGPTQPANSVLGRTSHGSSPRYPNQEPSLATASPAAAAAPAPPSALPALPLTIQSSLCACLSSLYLALSSLHTLPRDIAVAMQIARSACHAAHDAMQCPVCVPPLYEPNPYPMVTFTTMMTLGSLLPCIADAYHQILAMVDAETIRAIASETRSPLCFSLAAHGGIWGTAHAQPQQYSNSTTNNNDAAVTGSDQCTEAMRRFDEQNMDPAQWRLTLRALLKVDVYGLSRCDGGEGFTQVGLRDLVAQMDEKSRQRHAQVDQMLEAGLAAPVGLAGMQLRHTNQSMPHCRKVIAMAREAVDSIVIA